MFTDTRDKNNLPLRESRLQVPCLLSRRNRRILNRGRDPCKLIYSRSFHRRSHLVSGSVCLLLFPPPSSFSLVKRKIVKYVWWESGSVTLCRNPNSRQARIKFSATGLGGDQEGKRKLSHEKRGSRTDAAPAPALSSRGREEIEQQRVTLARKERNKGKKKRGNLLCSCIIGRLL